MEKHDLFWSLNLGGAIVYGTVLLGSTLGLRLSNKAPKRVNRMRLFLKLGPAFGLAMGAMIGGTIGMHYLAFDGFQWPNDAALSKEYAIQYGLFAALWISHFHLEIWTQEPLRKTPSIEGGPWQPESQRVLNQMTLNSALFLALIASSA